MGNGCDTCGCDLACYGYTAPTCHTCDSTCYGYAGCTCNMTCYGYGAYVHYRVQIDSIGPVDTFKWSDDGGTTWKATGVLIQAQPNMPSLSQGFSGAFQNLNNGVQVKFDNQTGHTLSDYWDFWAGDGVFIGERLIYYFKNYGGLDLAYHELHKGSPTQDVASQLQFEIPEWNEKMRNTAYSYFRLTYNAQAWQQIGDFTVVLKGRKLYDPRINDTVFSRNPALVWLDFMTNPRYGLGVPLGMVDLDSVMDVANWCDENSYTFDGIILDRTYFSDHLDQIMMNFRAFYIWSEGKYFLKVFTDDAAVMSLTADDIDINPESFSIQVPGVQDTPNLVKGTFSDKSLNYTANFAIDQGLTEIAYTGDPTPLELSLIGTSAMPQAKAIVKYARLRNKFGKQFTALAHPRCYALEPGDPVLITHEFPAWVNKKVRVQGMTLNQDGKVILTLWDEDPSIYA